MITKLFETIKCQDAIFHVWMDGNVTSTDRHPVPVEVLEYVENLHGVYNCDTHSGGWVFIEMASDSELIYGQYITNIEKDWRLGITNNSSCGLAPFKRGKFIPFTIKD